MVAGTKRFLDFSPLNLILPSQAFLDAGSGLEDKLALPRNSVKISPDAYQPEGKVEVIHSIAYLIFEHKYNLWSNRGQQSIVHHPESIFFYLFF
jgi:hypothetical protein